MVGALLVFILMAQTPGRAFISKEASFSVVFPGDPIQDTMTVPTPEGPQLRRMFRYSDDEAVYFIMHTCMPPPKSSDDPQEFLDLGRDGGLQLTGGKLISEKRLSLGGQPGRHLIQEVAGDRSYSRIFVGDLGAFYSLTAGPRSKAATRKALAFLDSFKILPPSPQSACRGE